jgi:NAD(P)-dependent dehydrogenase (short-subunit alcohol dehydrogenase family)
MSKLFDLEGRIVVVTGGLGRLGSGFVRSLLEHGARVAVFDLGASGRDGELEVAAAYPSRLLFADVDVTQRATIEHALAEIERRWGEPPFGLVNNAALDSPPNAPIEENGPFETYPESSFEKVIDVNVKGVVLCCQVLGQAMARARRGSIVNISSIYGLLSPDQRIYDYRRRSGEPFYKPVAYSVSKGALFNLTRYLATYWGAEGVRVNTLTFAGVFDNQHPEFLAAYEPKVPLRRMARMGEYDGAVVFLMSDAASYMTGSNIVIDGGFTAW